MESPPKTPFKIGLHSLAPTRNLDNNDNQYRVYRDCLSDAFSDPEMRNIALSGNLGAGKSSILHSFDKQRNGCEERFLYISLMDFEDYEKKCNCMNVSKQPKVSATSSVTSPGSQEQPKENSGNEGQHSDKPEKNKQDRKKDCRQETQKRVEYNLLCQILAHCTKSDLRNSSLRGIPEPSFSIPESLLIALFPVLIFVLIFRERFSSWGSLLLLKQASLTTIHLWLYPFLGLLLFGLFFYMIYNGKLTKLSFNSNHATAEIAFSDTQTSLDLYKFELVHALIKLRKKIDYTVVFEDMDRIDPQICIAVMTKLRDLNLLVNTRLIRKPSFVSTYLPDYDYQHHIRFIYAVGEDVLDHELRTKFFDCIIPVVPALNQYNTEMIFCNKLKDSGVKISGKESQEVFEQILQYLNDYRTVLTFCNEFFVLKGLFDANGDSFSDTDYDTAILLRITFYKVLVPQKYALVFSEEGQGEFPEVYTTDLVDFQQESYKADLANLLNKLRPGKLDMEILVTSAEKAKEHWLEILKNQYSPRKYRLSECLRDYTRVPIADELIAGNLVDNEDDTIVANNLFNHIKANSKDVEFKAWFFQLGDPMQFKFQNCIAFLAQKPTSSIEATEEPHALFSWCVGNLECMKSDKAHRDKWSNNDNMRDKLISLLWPYRDKIPEEVKTKLLTHTDTVSSLLDKEANNRMVDSWSAEIDESHVNLAYEQVRERQNIDETIEDSLENPEGIALDFVEGLDKQINDDVDEMFDPVDHAYEQVQEQLNIAEAIENSHENPEDIVADTARALDDRINDDVNDPPDEKQDPNN